LKSISDAGFEHWESRKVVPKKYREGSMHLATKLPLRNARRAKIARCWWLMPIILDTWRQRSRGLWFEASLHK
jgi:hypothetical protein